MAFLFASMGLTKGAWAGDFTPAGDFSFSSDAVAKEGFEKLTGLGTGNAMGLSTTPSDSALEGATVLSVATTQQAYSYAPLDVTGLADGNHVARLWLRHGTPSVFLKIGVKTSATIGGALAVFGPTGRVTSDGWIELQTNPFPVVSADIDQGYLVLMGTGEVDALEIVKQGDLVADAPCDGSPASCTGEGRLCLAGVCRNVDALVPPPPPDADRADAIAYLKSRIQNFFGGVISREKYLDQALAEADKLATAQSGWAFWNGWVTAVHRLHDWHTQTFGPVHDQLVINRRLQACFIDGVADSSQAAAPSDPKLPDVLVNHVGPAGTLGLHAGDRLVAVDGQHPLAWVASLIDRDWSYAHATDEASIGDAAERLYGLIPAHAHELTVVRCDAAKKTCASQTETIKVSDLPEDDGKFPLRCDHRPAYHTADAHQATDLYGNPTDTSHQLLIDVFGGEIDESQPDEHIYAMAWDYLYGADAGPLGQQISQKLNKQKVSWKNARGLILDHRRGEGGTTSSFSAFTPGFLPTTTVCVLPPLIQVAGVGGPATPAEGLDFYKHFGKYSVSNLTMEGKTPDLALPVALLLHRDVSASDYLAQGMKTVGGKLRLFGPHPTSGSFSTLYEYAYWGGVSWLQASGDSVLADGSTLIGKGVVPDEIVSVKQSDLIAGQDTVFNAALAWVRTELK
jgi:hypothetical protein